ncbi:MAG TPA: efflux RND transporter periplasmic adaptor subunit [Planctomycetaceae bacterium]|nr:efflux RND transporter periplasmic adaptor subunit [Planctomycetaceae bacterium]
MLVVFLIGMSGCQKAAPPLALPKPPEVIVARPVAQTVTDFEEYTGRLASIKMADLRARVSGYLEDVQFTDGADVAEGTALFRIDPRPFQSATEQAEGNVMQTEARLERLRKQEDRLKQLTEKNFTAIESYEQSQYDRMEAEAALKTAKASRDLANLNLEFTEITAPFAGRISRRLIDPGNLVRADETPLAVLVSLDPIYAYFDVDERTVLKVRRLIAEGKMSSAREKAIEVELGLADETEYTLKGRVNFVDNQISATTGTLRLRAEIDNPRKLLAPGMFVRVKVPIGLPRDALLVPEESLGSDQGHRFVYTLNDKDEVQYRRITAGRLSQGLRVVNEGLNSDERVVVSGLQRVRPGIKVAPKLEEGRADVKAPTPAGASGHALLVKPQEATKAAASSTAAAAN